MIDVSDNHRRMISITLATLDAMLCDFEAWADAGEIRSVLYRRTNRLTPPQVQEIHREAAEMRRMIAAMHQQLKLETRHEDVATMIWSQISCLWESLVELEGDGLRGYGAASPQLQTYLTPKAQELNRRLQRIGATVSHRATDAAS